jgi:E3 ubiquitin-protein ligase UBR4
MESVPTMTVSSQVEPEISHSRCYGCALASIEQIMTLLRGMATQMQCRVMLCDEGLIEELVANNLRYGRDQKFQEEVRSLLCLLTRDLPEPTERLCGLLKQRVLVALDGGVALTNMDSAVRNEMALLEAMAMQVRKELILIKVLLFALKFKLAWKLKLFSIDSKKNF